MRHWNRLPRGCGYPIPGSVQGHVGWGFEQPGLVEGVPDHSRWVGLDGLWRSLPTQTILWFYDSMITPSSDEPSEQMVNSVDMERPHHLPGSQRTAPDLAFAYQYQCGRKFFFSSFLHKLLLKCHLDKLSFKWINFHRKVSYYCAQPRLKYTVTVTAYTERKLTELDLSLGSSHAAELSWASSVF